MVLGWESYHDYVHLVMPGLGAFRSYGYNLSLAGFWHKLFDPAGEANVNPSAVVLPRSGTRRHAPVGPGRHGSGHVHGVSRAQDKNVRDLAFSAAVTAMLLVSPITWDVSLPLLLVPLMVLAFGRRAGNVPDSARTDGSVEGGSGIPLRLRIRLCETLNPASTSLKRKRCNPVQASWSCATLRNTAG